MGVVYREEAFYDFRRVQLLPRLLLHGCNMLCIGAYIYSYNIGTYVTIPSGVFVIVLGYNITFQFLHNVIAVYNEQLLK